MAEEKPDIHPTEAHRLAPNKDAQHAAADEKQMSLFQAIKLYPKAVGWSVVLSSALIMEGYDLALLGSLYGNPQFNMKYGKQNPVSGKWSVPANWQSALYVSQSPDSYPKLTLLAQIQRRSCRRSHRPCDQRLRFRTLRVPQDHGRRSDFND